MAEDRSGQFGVLILDAQGDIRFRSGVAAEAGVVAQLRTQAATAAPARALFTVTWGGERLVGVRCRAAAATVFLIHEEDAGDALLDFIASVDFAYLLLNHMLTDRFEAITVVDREARVRYISPVHEAFFGLSPGEAAGMPVQKVIENTRLHHVVQSGHAEIGHIQEMHGVSRVVARTPILRHGSVIGAMGRVMFKGPEQLLELSREIARLRSEVAVYRRKLSNAERRSGPLDLIVGSSDAIRQLKADLARIAPQHVPVLLTGESGTGKELAAHAIHALSTRAGQPLVLVNAAALPGTLVESELFGYEAGAFTGAERKGRRGRFELADKGTLFLDEIGEMPVEVQARLLRVVQDGRFERLGGEGVRRSDFRLISATNSDLKALIAAGRFRLDLYYRISTVVLHMPPLRERLDDIRAIVEDFVAVQRRIRRVHPDVYRYLAEQAWPGNVRQLLHAVERATIFADGDELRCEDFRAEAAAAPAPARAPRPRAAPPTIRETAHDVACAMVREALARCDGNKKRVARELGISRSYLYRLLATMPAAAPEAE